MRLRLRTTGAAAVSACLLLGACTSDVQDASGGTASPGPAGSASAATQLTWSRSTSADLGGPGRQSAGSVVAAGAGLVALGHDFPQPGSGGGKSAGGVVWTSTDGSQWTRVATQAFPSGCEASQSTRLWGAAAPGGPGIVAVGGTECGKANATWTSADGLSWQQQPGPLRGEMSDVTVGGPGLVAVGSSGPDAAVWTSPDGRTWTPAPKDKAAFAGNGLSAMSRIAPGGPGLVAIGSRGDGKLGAVHAAVWTSLDGETWTRVPDDESVFGSDDRPAGMSSVATWGPALVAVGYERTATGTGGETRPVVWTSPDGDAWTRVPAGQATFPTSEGRVISLAHVVALGPTLVVFGWVYDQDSGRPPTMAAWSSTDGVTWVLQGVSQLFYPGESWVVHDLAAAGPGLVVVGEVESADASGAEVDAFVLTATTQR